jgi:TolB-like protein
VEALDAHLKETVKDFTESVRVHHAGPPVAPAFNATHWEPALALAELSVTVPPEAVILTEAPERSWRRRAALVAGVLVALGIGGTTTWRLPGPAGTTAAVPSVVGLPSLAVLPIVNVTGDPHHDGVAAQLDAEVRASLSRLSGLSTSMVSADVRYVLDGSVRLVDRRPRVVATLVDTLRGDVVGTGHFDRALTNVAAAQRDLVQWIIAALPITLTADEQAARASRNPAPAPAVTQPAPDTPLRTTVNRPATRPPRANIEARPPASPPESSTESPPEPPPASPRDSEATNTVVGSRDDTQRVEPAMPSPPVSPSTDTPRAAPPPAQREIPHQAN